MTHSYWFYVGSVIYVLGVLLNLVTVSNFAKPVKNDAFNNCPIFETEYFIFRLVEDKDAKDLLKLFRL